MTNTKIQCNKCGAKFFILEREEIDCKCGHRINVQEHLKNNSKTPHYNKNIHEDIIDDLDDGFIEDEI